MLLCLASYEQCSTLLLQMLHKCCNTDVLGVLLIYPHSPSGAARPRDRAYISVKPLAAMLQPINIYIYSYSFHRESSIIGTNYPMKLSTHQKITIHTYDYNY